MLHPNRSASKLLIALSILTFGVVLPEARAALVDLATTPLIASTTTTVQPNLLLVLDDSGSMTWTYLPDAADDFRTKYGYHSSQCNGVYYNPNLTYTPPLASDKTPYPNASFTAARPDGFRGSTATTNLPTNLNNSFYYVYVPYTGSPAAMSWTYYSSGAANESTIFYRECMQTMAAAEASGRFRKVTLNTADTSAASDE